VTIKLTEDDIEVLYDHCDGYGQPALSFYNLDFTDVKKTLEEIKQQILENQTIVEKLKELYNSEFPFGNNSSRDWFADIAEILPNEPIPQWALDEWSDLKTSTSLDRRDNVSG
jgi:hypothetical protein